MATFQEILTEAVRDIVDHGFDSMERVEVWLRRLRQAAETEATPVHEMEEQLRAHLGAAYRRQVERGALLTRHPGISVYTIDKVRPELRAELERRLKMNRELIRLNRDAAIERVSQRFSGWASSVPAGGSDVVDVRKVKKDVRKSLAQLPFTERRVAIDQGHKFTAALSDIIAKSGGAIAGRWHSHWRETGYDYRPNHKRREGTGDGKVYIIRGSWAHAEGLVNRADGYTDEMTQPAEEPYCRCWYEYVYALRDLPESALTAKGKAALRNVRVA